MGCSRQVASPVNTALQINVAVNDPCPAGTNQPVRYNNGEVQHSETDLSTSGFGDSWGHQRTYRNQMSEDFDYGNGFNWPVRQWPYLVLLDGGSIVVVRAGRGSQWFDPDGGDYVGRYGILHTLAAGTGIFVLAAPDGTLEVFHNFAAGDLAGRYISSTTAGGNAVELSYDGDLVSEMQRSVTLDGVTVVESFLYAYGTGADSENITSVTLRRRLGEDGLWTNISRAVYTYYADGDVSGSAGDLKTVARQVPSGAGDWATTGVSYYRYYVDAAGGIGFAHGLKYSLGPDAFARLAAATCDPLTASNEQVARFAEQYYEYDAEHRVTRRKAVGGTQEFTYAYAENIDGGYTEGPNNWRTKTTETLPDGSQNIVFCNHLGQLMLTDYRNAGVTQRWITFKQYNDDYNVALAADPAAINMSASPIYDENVLNLDVQLRASNGLITTNVYYTDVGSSSGSLGPDKYLFRVWIKEGASGTPIKQTELEYSSNTAGSVTVYAVSSQTVYRDSTGAEPIVTTYAYEYHPGTNQLLQKTTTLPEIPVEQNGSGISATQRELYDIFGNMNWEQGPRLFVDFFAYDVITGARLQWISDVDPAKLALPEGWTRPELPVPKHQITDYRIDNDGRTIETLGPEHDVNGVATRRATWTAYFDAQHATCTAQGYVTGLPGMEQATLANPVSIARSTPGAGTSDSISAVVCGLPAFLGRREGTASAALCDCFPQSTWVGWSRQQVNDAGQLSASRVYHTIPLCAPACAGSASSLDACGTVPPSPCCGDGANEASRCWPIEVGQPGTHFDETTYAYDLRGHVNRTRSPGGTITRTIADVLGRTLGTFIGTGDAGATEDDPTGGGAPGNNMVQVSGSVYPTDCTCGQAAEVTKFIDDNPAHNRVTTFTLDFRNRVTVIDGEIDYYQINVWDNLNHVVRVDRQDTNSGGNLIARADTEFDDRGRAYRQTVYAVDPSTGTVGNSLVSDTWYDAADNVIKTLPAGSQQFTKTVYDSQARKIADYVGYYTGSGSGPGDGEPYEDVGEPTADNKIFAQMLISFDPGGNSIQVAAYQRLSDATGGGALNPPESSTQPLARVMYAAGWFDGLGRQTATANYGTNDDEAFERPATPPARSDDVLVTDFRYNDAGRMFETIDSSGRAARQSFDAAGRQMESIQNYTGAGPGNDHDITVRHAHNADGNLVALTAVNPTTGDQTTRYEYGTTLTNSAIASNLLLRSTIYPDAADGQDRVTLGYNRQGETVKKTDQNGTVHEYVIDKLKRLTDDKVTTLGEGIDENVRRLSFAYEVRGLLETASSHSATSGGSTWNEVLRVYNDFGLPVTEYQAHDSAVNTSTSPKVEYAYADGSTNTVRPVSMTYPNGRVLEYDYGTAGDDDKLSRIGSLIFGGTEPSSSSSSVSGTEVAAYTFQGLSTFETVAYPEPGIARTFDLDRFGRPVEWAWQKTSDSSYLSHWEYGYDRSGNRLFKKNLLSSSVQDELYCYDGLSRLTRMFRGQLESGNVSVTLMQFTQAWRLDATGNWSEFRQTANNFSSSDDFDQQRASNRANEIVAIDQYFGTAWAQPWYDRAGNMLVVPKPGGPTQSANAEYDAWNRLVRLDVSATIYRYDALNRRTHRISENHFYYSLDWRLLEVGGDSEQQLVWGQQYIDDLVLRDRTVTDPLDERSYALQDANWNVVALSDASGAVQMRMRYSAYGTPAFLTAGFVEAGNAYAWDILFCGYRYDLLIGLYHVRNRELNSATGTWLTRDPIGYQFEDRNLYQYVGAMPTNRRDPSGLGPCDGEAWTIDSLVKCFLECPGADTLHESATRAAGGKIDFGPSKGWAMDEKTGRILYDTRVSRCDALRRLTWELSNLTQRSLFQRIGYLGGEGYLTLTDFVSLYFEVEHRSARFEIGYYGACHKCWKCEEEENPKLVPSDFLKWIEAEEPRLRFHAGDYEDIYLGRLYPLAFDKRWEGKRDAIGSWKGSSDNNPFVRSPETLRLRDIYKAEFE